MVDSEFQTVIDRLVKACSYPNEQALAADLGFKQSAFATRKMRGSLPRKEIDALIGVRGLNPDWVYEGRGPIFVGSSIAEKIRLQETLDAKLAPFDLNQRQRSYLIQLLLVLETKEPRQLRELLDGVSNLSVDEELILRGYRCAPDELAVAIKYLAASSRHLAERAKKAAQMNVGPLVIGDVGAVEKKSSTKRKN